MTDAFSDPVEPPDPVDGPVPDDVAPEPPEPVDSFPDDASLGETYVGDSSPEVPDPGETFEDASDTAPEPPAPDDAPIEGSATNLTEPGDKFGLYAERAEPLEGCHDVIVHGSPTDFGASPTAWQDGKSFDHNEVAGQLRGDPGYPEATPVRLISCSTGSRPDGAAQNLANELGVEVTAPTDIVWAYPDGTLTVGPEAGLDSGSWRTFRPERDRRD